MLFQKRLQNLFLFKVFMGLLLLVSFCFAQSGTWTPKASIPTPRCFAGSCELNGKIYVIGGAQTLSSSLKTMEVYDPATNTWDTTKASMLTARAELCVAAVNGKIYAIGGATSHQGSPLGIVEEYDPLTDTWITKKPMLTPRKQPACGVINNKICIAGGSASLYTGSNILEVYDPANDTWTTKDNMLAARYAPQGTVLNETFYVIGGLIGSSPWTGRKEVQKYDPITDNWAWGSNLKHGRVGHTADVVNGKIYVIGGDTQPPLVENVEEYDPQTEIWKVIDPTPYAMVSHTSSVYGNEIYVFSGSTKTITQLTLTDSVYSYEPPPPAPVFTVTPDSFLFGKIPKGDTLIDSVMVINAGNVDLIINSVTSSHPLFSISPTSGVISPDSNSQFYIQFRADTLPSSQQGVLVFHHNGLTSPDSIIAKADVIDGIVSQDATIPRKFTLHQNYPNPFNPTTNIEFSIPKSEFVTLKVYNILGEEVATLVSERLTTGSYRYEWNASTLASGVYLYRLQAGDYVETRKMVLIK